MILVDSSAWIELLRATGSPTHRRLRSLIEGGEHLATTGPVSMELLAGARGPAHRQRLRRALAACEMAQVRGERDWEDAASIYLRCRSGGDTPRRLLDCLIAAVAIRVGASILSEDRDYEAIARHTALRLADGQGGPT